MFPLICLKLTTLKKLPTIALVGNPNCGKSSLFNQLTGLRQKTGNFPGVTVDRKTGTCQLDRHTEVSVLDLPGTYSLYPKSLDEQVVLDVLLNPAFDDYPDVVVVVADASNLKRNLLLFSQIRDLGFKTVLALNMVDVAEKQGYVIDPDRLAARLGIPVVLINAKMGEGTDNLKFAIKGCLLQNNPTPTPVFNIPKEYKPLLSDVKKLFGFDNDYRALLLTLQYEQLTFLTPIQRQQLSAILSRLTLDPSGLQANETLSRYEYTTQLAQEASRIEHSSGESFTTKADRILLHKFWGYAIFLGVLLLIFQSIFSLAQYPMDLLDGAVGSLSDWLKEVLPASKLVDLLTDGLLAGIGGVIVFVPQIAFLFCFISLLEESGYMARVMVLMDKLMRKFGLNGKSVVPLISGVACAVPAIMATRSIGNWKDRLISIMVTPLMSCSARLPIYTIMIALVVPDQAWGGLFNLQGLALMALYLLGFGAALASAWVLSKVLQTKERSYFIMELPVLQLPRWHQVALTVWSSAKTFVGEAGKVIVAISIILWVLASYGPADGMERAEAQVRGSLGNADPALVESKVAAARLEHSYAGHFGKWIEPAIRPLGYDWKIGIALLTSFAAREVFVGTISTIYSIGAADDDVNTVKERLRKEINPQTGQPMFSLAVAFSLMIFYVFAMQCMSTLATTYRETKGWKYPVIQLVYMTVLAYVAALGVYVLLS